MTTKSEEYIIFFKIVHTKELKNLKPFKKTNKKKKKQRGGYNLASASVSSKMELLGKILLYYPYISLENQIED